MLSSLSLSFGALLVVAAGYLGLRSLVVAGSATWLVQHTEAGRRRRVYRRAAAPGQWRSELTAGVVTLGFDALVLATVLHLELLPVVPPTPWNLGLGFGLLFVWFEIWFYVTHRLLHLPALYPLHAQHHVARVTQPLTSISFSLAERAVLHAGSFGFAALTFSLLPLPFEAFALYFSVNYLLNVLGHSNVEVVPRASRWVLTPTFHAMHHARHAGHYGLFTQVLDRLFGTVFDDYEAMHARAREGRGATRLSERA